VYIVLTKRPSRMLQFCDPQFQALPIEGRSAIRPPPRVANANGGSGVMPRRKLRAGFPKPKRENAGPLCRRRPRFRHEIRSQDKKCCGIAL